MAITVNGKRVAGIGVPGKDGKSAYTSAVEAGYTGTETAFNAALSNVPGHIENGTIHVTDEQKEAWSAKADKPKSIPVTLTASGWDATVKTQTVAVAGVSADENTQEIRYIYPGASAAAVVAAGLYISATAENSVTFACLNDVPTADIAVCVGITEINYVA